MKVEGYTFALFGVFLVGTDVVYWLTSYDWTGTVVLGLSGLFGWVIGYYLLFTARRLGPRPEDLGDAEIADGAGEVGFFSPYSYWPIMLAAGAVTFVMGFIFGLWLGLIGFVLVGFSVVGLLFEYYVGQGAIARAGGLEASEHDPHH